MLETDPAARQPRAYYEARYQRMALQELTGALDMHRRLEAAHGAAAVDACLRTRGMKLLLADSRLARDNLVCKLEKTEAQAAGVQLAP